MRNKHNICQPQIRSLECNTEKESAPAKKRAPLFDLWPRFYSEASLFDANRLHGCSRFNDAPSAGDPILRDSNLNVHLTPPSWIQSTTPGRLVIARLVLCQGGSSLLLHAFRRRFPRQVLSCLSQLWPMMRNHLITSLRAAGMTPCHPRQVKYSINSLLS
mgnify:CR=1 FL=1